MNLQECHPDTISYRDAAAEERFQKINHAHNTLLHVGLRRMYDLQLRRKEAFERCERMERAEPWVTKFLAGQGGTILCAAGVGVLAASALMLGTMGGEAFLRASNGLLWSMTRYLPDWLPGKWHIISAVRRRGEPAGE
ncbi:DNAJC5B [Symbiodinium natans]|uniref:DNAJC5B protein n=1 Tax=Symbiodinium natans TaxID=878477 RepID=A0A812KCH0_9DINO|nr:DNAJC5B [Symbiodinium natans]